MAGVKFNELITLKGFPKGINNRAKEEAVPDDALRAAMNIDLDRDGKLRRRQGFTLAKSLTNCCSLWAHVDYPFLFVASGGMLHSFNASLETVASVALTSSAPISYALAAGRVYWSNGLDMGCVRDGVFETWALEQPGGNPDLSPSVGIGGLEAGCYQVAATFLHSDGRESGATLATLVDLATGDGIQLANIPQPTSADIEFVRLYRTSHNGDVLFLAMDIPVGLTSMLLGHQQLGRALETQFRQAMPAGQIVRLHNGRLLVARGNVLYWSDTFNYGLTKLTENYVQFSHEITMLEPVGHAGNASLYVASGDRLFSVLGEDPKTWARSIAASYGVVRGASCSVDGKSLGLDTTGDVAVWMNKTGSLVAGLQGGLLVPLHDAQYSGLYNIESGAMATRDINGMSQLIATLKGGNRAGLTTSDSVEAEVWKDGRRIS